MADPKPRRRPWALLAVAVLIAIAVFVAVRQSGDDQAESPDASPGAVSGTDSDVVNTSPVATTPEPASTAQSVVDGYVWKPVRIGGGGYITGLSAAADGTLVARSDTYGGYVRAPGSSEWRQLLTSTAVPQEWRVPKMGKGVYSIAVAPSDSSRIYLVWSGHLFVSSDQGLTFSQTTFDPVVSNANAPFGRGFGDKLAVDPFDPDLVLAGGPDVPLRRSTDGGVTWTDTDLPAGLEQPRLVETTGGEIRSVGTTGLSFDPTSATGDSTSVVYAASWGNGVFRSDDRGESWTPQPGPAGTKYVIHGDVDADGTYVALTGDRDGPFGVFTLTGSVWTEITPDGWSPGEIGEVENPFLAVSPAVADTYVIGYAGQMFATTDAGGRWDALSWRETDDGDVTWAADTEDDNPYLVAGDLIFDLVESDRIWLATGEGVQTAVLRENETLEWVETTRGIESMVATDVASTLNGPPVFGVFDFGQFSGSTSLDDYSLVKGPVDYFSGTTSVAASPFAEGFAVSATTDYVQHDTYPLSSGYTDDGGATWTVFPSMPADANSAKEFGYGTIAVGEPDNIVWAPGRYFPTQSTDFRPYYTTDRGESWLPVDLPGVESYPEDSTGGFMFGRNRQTVVADPVTPGVFYLYMLGEGLFRSTDRGASWARLHGGDFSLGDPTFTVQLGALPGIEGNLFYTDGPAGGDNPIGPQDHDGFPLLRSRDGGAAWEQVPGVSKVLAFGFGAPAPDQTVGAIYLAGDVNDEYGIWQSIDDARTWVKIGDFPYTVDWAGVIGGDMNTFGTVYIGFGGSSYVYGNPAG